MRTHVLLSLALVAVAPAAACAQPLSDASGQVVSVRVWDPVESEFVTELHRIGSPNAAAAAADAARYTVRVRVFTPHEGEFVTEYRPADAGASAAAAAADAARYTGVRRIWDPVESEFVSEAVPAY